MQHFIFWQVSGDPAQYEMKSFPDKYALLEWIKSCGIPDSFRIIEGQDVELTII